MNDCHALFRAACLLLMGATYVWAQDSGSGQWAGVPQDWSDRQIVFSRDTVLQNPQLITVEPRIQHQILQRWGSADQGVFQGIEAASDSSATGSHRDWNVTLGGRVAPLMFPAKYSFDPGAPPSCSGDYVVFGLNTAGTTGGRANLVAFNNLYSGGTGGGFCQKSAPTVLFAYNITTVTTGKVSTSPVLSPKGDKIAFVESSPTSSNFHVLTWTAGQGTINRSAPPNMTTLALSASNNTRSSPWVDYNTDTAYVGADNGLVYKIHPVFNGTPALVSGWPVTLSSNVRLTPPVLDKNLGLLLVGSQNGTLYSINTTTRAVKSLVVGKSGATNPGILAPPIVDVAHGTTFVVSSNNGTSAVFEEVDTASLTALATANIGIGSKSGTAVNLYQPAFDNNYFNNPSTGRVRLCGTGTGTDITPRQYAFGFTGRVMNTAPVFSQQLSTTTTARCTGWTEFYNPNINGGTDYFFFGLTTGCPTSATSGCVVERLSDTSLVTFNLPGGPSGIVIDNYSTDAQASSIYLTDQATPNAAYKLTQNGLQ